MYQIAYRSQATETLDNADVFNILVRSTAKNGHNNLGGFLIFLNGMFFQVPEGSLGDVNATYVRILADPRHAHIEILYESEVPARIFENWRMRRLRIRHVDEIESAFAEIGVVIGSSPILPYLENFLLDKLSPRHVSAA